MKRPARLILAKAWIKEYNGKDIIKGYAKWFGVDKICAILELKSIGFVFPEERVNRIMTAHHQKVERNKQIQKMRETASEPVRSGWDDIFAYVAGYTSGGFPYGLTYEDMDRIEAERTFSELDQSCPDLDAEPEESYEDLLEDFDEEFR